MRWTQSLSVWSVAVSVVLAAAWVGWAGPSQTARPRLPDTIRSLAKVRQVRIDLPALAEELLNAGIEREELLQQIRLALKKADITEVAEADEETATLQLRLMALTDDFVPDGVAYIVSIRLVQPVFVSGHRDALNVPTFAQVGGSLEKKRNVKGSLQTVMDLLIQQFTSGVEAATRRG